MNELELLKRENEELKRKLNIAKNWMQKSVKEEVQKISKKKLNKMTSKIKSSFLQENIEDIITRQINNFFGEFILMNTPSGVVDNIVSGEINFYNLKQNTNVDGFAVISSYHKAIDIIIESVITKGFRKYSKKQNQTILRKNLPIEKSLHSVVNQGFILSLGRLYHILRDIKTDNPLNDYTKTFKNYLIKYEFLNNILLNNKFLDIFEQIIDSEILGKKRHIGNVHFEETKKIRDLLVGDFKNKESFIYMLLSIQELEF